MTADELDEIYAGRELTDAAAGVLRAFLAAADAALTREGLSRHPRAPLLARLRRALEEYDRRSRTLH